MDPFTAWAFGCITGINLSMIMVAWFGRQRKTKE